MVTARGSATEIYVITPDSVVEEMIHGSIIVPGRCPVYVLNIMRTARKWRALLLDVGGVITFWDFEYLKDKTIKANAF